MDYAQLLILTAAGVFAGWLNVMAGGGSLLTVPIMLFMGIPAPVANGTNRIGILMQNVSAVTAFFRRGFSDFRLSLSLAAAASFGAIGGAMAGVNLEGEWFDRLLALVMAGVMILMVTGKRPPGPTESGNGKPKRLLLGHLCMVGAGFWGGLIQIGVGFILMPILHRVMGFDLVRVNMHKVFVVLVYTAIALAVFAAHVEILWVAGLALALGTVAGGWLGVHTTVRHGDIWIRRVLFVTLSAFIAKLLWP
jgi:uncharacterized membrane protein YfcA